MALAPRSRLPETLEESRAPSNVAIAREIRLRITGGIFPMGARISDKQLALELAVSRTPVREALVQLQSEGLVVTRPQSGTFVFDLSVEDVREICALRAIIETGALRLADGAGAREHALRLAPLLSQAAIALDDGKLDLCDELDCQFHEGIVAASGNSYMVRAYRAISDKLRALRHRLPRDRERMAGALAQHRRIIDLWSVGRLDQAVAELTAHVGNVERLLVAAENSVTRRIETN